MIELCTQFDYFYSWYKFVSNFSLAKSKSNPEHLALIVNFSINVSNVPFYQQFEFRSFLFISIYYFHKCAFTLKRFQKANRYYYLSIWLNLYFKYSFILFTFRVTFGLSLNSRCKDIWVREWVVTFSWICLKQQPKIAYFLQTITIHLLSWLIT